MRERLGSQLKLWFHFQDHPILISLGEDRRYQPLPESVVERVVDRRRRDPEAARRRPVDVHECLQPAVLQIGRDVGKLR